MRAYIAKRGSGPDISRRAAAPVDTEKIRASRNRTQDRRIRRSLHGGTLFEELDFYVGPIDGPIVDDLVDVCNTSKRETVHLVPSHKKAKDTTPPRQRRQYHASPSHRRHRRTGEAAVHARPTPRLDES